MITTSLNNPLLHPALNIENKAPNIENKAPKIAQLPKVIKETKISEVSSPCFDALVTTGFVAAGCLLFYALYNPSPVRSSKIGRLYLTMDFNAKHLVSCAKDYIDLSIQPYLRDCQINKKPLTQEIKDCIAQLAHTEKLAVKEKKRAERKVETEAYEQNIVNFSEKLSENNYAEALKIALALKFCNNIPLLSEIIEKCPDNTLVEQAIDAMPKSLQKNNYIKLIDNYLSAYNFSEAIKTSHKLDLKTRKPLVIKIITGILRNDPDLTHIEEAITALPYYVRDRARKILANASLTKKNYLKTLELAFKLKDRNEKIPLLKAVFTNSANASIQKKIIDHWYAPNFYPCIRKIWKDSPVSVEFNPSIFQNYEIIRVDEKPISSLDLEKLYECLNSIPEYPTN